MFARLRLLYSPGRLLLHTYILLNCYIASSNRVHTHINAHFGIIITLDACNLLPQCIHFRFQTLCAFSFFFLFAFCLIRQTIFDSTVQYLQKFSKKEKKTAVFRNSAGNFNLFAIFFVLLCIDTVALYT